MTWWLRLIPCLSIVALIGCSNPVESSPDISGSHADEPIVVPSFAVSTGTVAARKADEFVNTIGVNVHLSYFQTPYGTAWSSVVKPKILGLGVRHLRDGGIVVPDNNWMSIVYGRMKELLPGLIKFNLVMRPAVGSADYVTMSHLPRLLSYAAPVIESFEGLNEHDLSKRAGWVAETRSFQKSLYQAVRADPRTGTMPVFGPALGNPGNAPLVGDLTPYLNYGNIHPYPGGNTPLPALIDHQNKVKPVSGSRRLVVTESGYHNAMLWTGGHPPVSELAMGHYTLRLLFDYFNAGIPRTWLYEMIDQGVDQTRRELNFGLLRMNGSEKPVYVALRNLINLLKDPGASFAPGQLHYGLAGDLTGLSSTLLQKRDGRFFLVLWQDPSCFNLLTRLDLVAGPKFVTLSLPQAAGIKVYQPGTSANPLLQGTMTPGPLAVPDHPLIVEITP